jgi:phage terminase large subunit
VELGSRVAARIKYYEPDAVFIDEGGVGGGVVDFVRSLGHHVIGVNFGSKPSSNPLGIHVANKRAEMYLLLRDAIREGLAIDQSSDLYDQLCEVEYYINKREEVILVSKDDMAAAGKESPDLADALALTFAYPVASRRFGKAGRSLLVDYDPLAYSALPNFSEPAKGDAYTGW